VSHDRSDLTEDNVLPGKTRTGRLESFGPSQLGFYVRGGRADKTEVDFIGEESTLVVPDGETSPVLYRAKHAEEIAAELDPSGTAKLQHTISSIQDVTGGTANWVDWGPGEVSAVTQAFIDQPVTALRVVSVDGEVQAHFRTESDL